MQQKNHKERCRPLLETADAHRGSLIASLEFPLETQTGLLTSSQADEFRKTLKIGELIEARREIPSGTIAYRIIHNYCVHYNKHSPNAVNWIIYGLDLVFREP
jgi:hypothetical protein